MDYLYVEHFWGVRIDLAVGATGGEEFRAFVTVPTEIGDEGALHDIRSPSLTDTRARILQLLEGRAMTLWRREQRAVRGSIRLSEDGPSSAGV